jgi:hypothetical protein
MKSAQGNRKTPSSRSLKIAFSVGAIMLVLPLALVVSSSPSCTPGSVCSKSNVYRFGYTLFPYIMIAGGVIIGYNMKRLSDSLRPSEPTENEDT